MPQNNKAASNIRKHFNRQGSGRFDRTQDVNDDGNGSAEPNELTILLTRMTSTDSGTPYYNHSNPIVKYPFLVLYITWEILRTNYVNVLLVFVPLGIVSGLLHWNPTVIFILNFFAIVPLASLLAFATEELSVPLGQTIGGLLNATFGNAVELIVRKRMPRIPGRPNQSPGQHHCA